MKTVFLFLSLLLSFSMVNAQKIKLKKGNILLDGKEIMKFEREDWGTQKISLYTLSDNKEQILMIKNKNETPRYFDDDFVQIKFLQSGDMVEMKSTKSWKGIIKWLIKQNVISEDGIINEENLPLFVKNYDENITNRTIRH